MTLYVLTWFRRAAPGSSSTGWARGIRAFVDEPTALEAWTAERRRARSLAAGPRQPAAPTTRTEERRAQRLSDEAERYLRASSVELVAYDVGELSLELLAAVVSSPPRGDGYGHGDGWDVAGDWWTASRIVAHWSGSEPNKANR